MGFWDRERLLTSHVTSATVLLACLTLTLGRDAFDLTPAVTSFLALIDQTRHCMRLGPVIDDMSLVLACARYWREVGLHVEIGMQQPWKAITSSGIARALSDSVSRLSILMRRDTD